MTSNMNTNYKMKEDHVSNISLFEDRKIKPGLKRSVLMNNKMNYNNRTYILDEPTPDIGITALSPPPFRRRVQSLRDTAKKAANTAKRKWNDYYDWLSTYDPPKR